MITVLAAVDKFGGIGRKNTIPWKHSLDMKWFKNTTKHSTVIMGRRTWDSLPLKPLPERTNIVITSQVTSPTFLNNVMFVPSLRDLLIDVCQPSAWNDKTYIIGGSTVYKQALDSLTPNELIISYINVDGQCDTFFPAIPIIYRPSKIEEFGNDYKRITYVRNF